MKPLTLDSKPYISSKRLSSHLVGSCTPVNSVVVRRLNGEDQLVLGSTASSDVGKVQLGVIAVPVDLS